MTVGSGILSGYAYLFAIFYAATTQRALLYRRKGVLLTVALLMLFMQLGIHGPAPGIWPTTPHPKPGLLYQEIQVSDSKALEEPFLSRIPEVE